MKNIGRQLDGDTLVIRVDLTKDFGESMSGKSITIASTEGYVAVPGREAIKIGLNVYRKKWGDEVGLHQPSHWCLNQWLDKLKRLIRDCRRLLDEHFPSPPW